MRTTPLVLILWAAIPLPAWSQQPDNDLGRPLAELTLTTDNPYGNLSGLAEPADSPWDTLTGWGTFRAVPDLATSAYARAGDDLAVTVSLELEATAPVWVRVVVDGVAAKPNVVTFKSGSTALDGVRTFTFVRPDVGAGQHLIVVEAMQDPGKTVKVGRRTVTANTGSRDWGNGQLAVAYAQTYKATPIWANVPGLSTSVTTTSGRTLILHVSGVPSVSLGPLRVRAVIDGVPGGDVVMAEAGGSSRRGARTAILVGATTTAGTHTVQIQAVAPDGILALPTLALEASRSGSRGGLAYTSSQGTLATVSSTGFTTLDALDGALYTLSFTTNPETSSASVIWSGEVRLDGAGKLRARLLIDSAPIEVVLARGGGTWRAVTATFTATNLALGSHNLGLQVAVDSGTTATIRDRALRVVHKQRSGSELARGLPGTSIRPRHQSANLLVICFDPVRAGHPRPSIAQVRGHFQGTDGDVNLKDWLIENSGGHHDLGAVMYRGCVDGAWYTAPPAHQGSYYWNLDDKFVTMRRDALAAVDPDFYFHSWDWNGDRRLTREEVTTYLVIPQASPYGAKRSATAPLDGVADPMTLSWVDLYVSADPTKRRKGVGVLAHESGHALLPFNHDLYGCTTPYPLGKYSIMAEDTQPWHLDPFIKLKTGMVSPELVHIPTWQTRTVSLAAIESRGKIVILHDPTRGDREYFILEYRWGEGPSVYDSGLPDVIVVWHVFEDRELALATRPPGSDCGKWVNSIRRIALLTMPTASIDLAWSDGTPTGLRVTNAVVGGEVASVDITRP